MTAVPLRQHIAHRLAMSAGLAAWIALLGPAAHAQQAAASAPAGAPNTLESVKVTGQSSKTSGDPSMVDPEKSRVLSRSHASSCNFMSSYSAANDPVTLAYMRDFKMQDSPSNEAERFSDLSPEGNAKTAAVGSALEDTAASIASSGTDAMAPSVGCSGTDKRFAAGRNYIARKDKSLAQGFDAYEARNYIEARAKFEEAWRKLPDAEEAALMLARIHLLGLGTPRNTSLAIEWLRKVAEAPYDPVGGRMRFDPAQPENISTRVEATLLLARIALSGGPGTPRDPAQAYKWWSKALDFGFEPAGTLLAQAHLRGIGTKVDVKPAMAYLEAAGEAGDAKAHYLLGQLYHHQLPRQPDGVPLDLKRAGAYYAAAAKAGNAEAMLAAARMLDLGEGVSAPQPERALLYYRDAALKGNAEAQNALATYFYRGDGVAQNLPTARLWFQTAAKQRQPDAMFNLAVMLAQGQGGDKDMAAAYAWCSLSKELGHEQAATALPAIAAKLSPEEKARADAMLKPAPKKS